jgi:hypothetical protein
MAKTFVRGVEWIFDGYVPPADVSVVLHLFVVSGVDDEIPSVCHKHLDSGRSERRHIHFQLMNEP